MSNKFEQHKTKAEMTRYVSACTVYAVLWGAGVIFCLVLIGQPGVGFWGVAGAAICAWFGYIRAKEVYMYYALRSAYRSGDTTLTEDPELQVIFGDDTSTGTGSHRPAHGTRSANEIKRLSDPNEQK